jgi:NitT/TauT family transport system permease protein/sulfonate transport system permease protein
MSAHHASPRRRGPWLRDRLPGYLLVLGLFGLWELSARALTASESWPPFTTVLRALAAGLAGGDLGAAAGSSLGRMLAGYAIGGAAGVLIGLAMALSRVVHGLLDTSIELLRPIPIPAIVPPLVLLLGIDDAMKVSVIAFAAFFPVLVNTVQGARALDPTLRDMTRTFRVGPLRRLLQVVFPASLPYVFAGLRISLALAMIVTIVAEMIAGSQGLGYYLVSMQYAMRPADMYAAVVLIAVAGYAMTLLFLTLERKLLPWYHQNNDL